MKKYSITKAITSPHPLARNILWRGEICLCGLVMALALLGLTSLAATVTAETSNPVVNGSEHTAISKIRVSVDWPQFMSRQDLVWNRLPQDYYEGAFVGAPCWFNRYHRHR